MIRISSPSIAWVALAVVLVPLVVPFGGVTVAGSDPGAAAETGTDVYYQTPGVPSGPPAPAGDSSTYPRYGSLDNRTFTWFVTQQHTYFGGFVSTFLKAIHPEAVQARSDGTALGDVLLGAWGDTRRRLLWDQLVLHAQFPQENPAVAFQAYRLRLSHALRVQGLRKSSLLMDVLVNLLPSRPLLRSLEKDQVGGQALQELILITGYEHALGVQQGLGSVVMEFLRWGIVPCWKGIGFTREVLFWDFNGWSQKVSLINGSEWRSIRKRI